jgi:hypothetical protein
LVSDIREEHGLRVFENSVLRSIFGPKRHEVTGGWRKLHNKESHDLYPLPSIIRKSSRERDEMCGHVAQLGEEEHV